MESQPRFWNDILNILMCQELIRYAHLVKYVFSWHPSNKIAYFLSSKNPPNSFGFGQKERIVYLAVIPH